jgi:hypothetical protein
MTHPKAWATLGDTGWRDGTEVVLSSTLWGECATCPVTLIPHSRKTLTETSPKTIKCAHRALSKFHVEAAGPRSGLSSQESESWRRALGMAAKRLVP